VISNLYQVGNEPQNIDTKVVPKKTEIFQISKTIERSKRPPTLQSRNKRFGEEITNDKLAANEEL
jgi:hypothetical protein